MVAGFGVWEAFYASQAFLSAPHSLPGFVSGSLALSAASFNHIYTYIYIYIYTHMYICNICIYITVGLDVTDIEGLGPAAWTRPLGSQGKGVKAKARKKRRSALLRFGFTALELGLVYGLPGSCPSREGPTAGLPMACFGGF